MQKTRGWFLSILLYVVFAIYLLFLAVILFRSYTEIPVWNLYPLRTIVEYVSGFDYVTGRSHGMLENAPLANLLGNVAIFLPLGVYVALFRKNGSLWKTTAVVAAVSLALELLQVATRTGSGDVDDMLLNALGGLLGALLYRGICHICGGTDKARTAVTLLAPLGGIVCFVALNLISRFP